MSDKKGQKLVRFDWAMKNILRKKSNFDILEGFLTCLLNEEIKIEELMESESNKDGKDQKLNRVDLKCKDSTGRHIIVEIQSERQIDYFERIAWGASKALVESLDEGEDYLNIAKIISVSILYHNLYFPETNKDYIYEGGTEIIGRHTKARLLMNKEKTGIPVTSGEVFPEYYLICVNNFDEKIRDAIDEWVYLFKKERVKDGFAAPGIDKATKKLGYLQMPPEERARYDRYVDNARYENSVLNTKFMDGKDEGREEGRAEGRAEGISIGRNEGKLEMVANMFAAGMSVEQISAISKLPHDEIIALK